MERLAQDGDQTGYFVAPMQDIVPYMARGQEDRYNGKVGDALCLTASDAIRDCRATLKTPRYPQVDLVTMQCDDKGQMRYEAACDAGFYDLSFAKPAGATVDMYFARNVDPLEGDLAPSGQTGIAAAMDSNDFHYEQRNGSEVTVADNKPSKEYWLWIIGAMLVFMAMEIYLAQRFGHYS